MSPLPRPDARDTAADCDHEVMTHAPRRPYTLVISSSLDAGSKSRRLAQAARAELESTGATTRLLDLGETPVPAFDNGDSFESEAFGRAHALIDGADSVVVAMPVYNWSAGSAAKNLIELTGATGENGRRAAWFDKIVTFLCAGGLPHSYMAYSALAASMMLDFKCIVNPYVVYATERDWATPDALTDTVAARLRKTIAIHSELRDRLRDRTYSSDWEI